MYLTNITARSFKGGDFSVALTRANVIVGDNFAGKTRIADAVRLLLVGYLPELGKTNQATFGLACGPVMEVEGVFDNGETILRRWSAKGDSVKYEFAVPESFNAIKGVLAVMLNAEEYFALSETERVKYVAANVPGKTELTPRAVCDRLGKVEGVYQGTDKGCPLIDKLLGIYEDRPDSTPTMEFVELSIASLSEEWKRSKETVKRMEETVRGLTALRSQDAETRPAAAIEDDLGRNARAQTELQERKNLKIGAYTAMRSARVRRAEIARELNAAEKDRAEHVRLERKLELVLRELGDPHGPATGTAPKIAELAKASADRQAEYNRIGEDIQNANRRLFVLEKEIDGLEAAEICPFCGAKGDGWKAIKAAELTEEVEKLKTESVGFVIKKVAAIGSLNNARISLRDAEDAAERVLRLSNEEKTVRVLLAQIAPRIERAKNLEEERARLAPEDPELETAVSMIQSELNVKTEEARGLQLELRNAAARAGDLQRLAQAEEQRDAAKKEQDAAAAAGKELRAIQAELVAATFGPLLEIANSIFGSVLLSPLAYRDGEIGTWRGGLWVGHRTFSGVEKLLTYSAIQAALAAASPVKVVLLDEMGRLVRARVPGVATALTLALGRGVLDQALVIDPERPDLYDPSQEIPWNLIQVG